MHNDRVIFPISEEDQQYIYDGLPEATWRSLSGSRIFITGGTGFVGKWLVLSILLISRKLSLGVKITLLSRNPDGAIRDLPFLADAAEVDWVKGDVRNFSYPHGHYDFVIHAATDVAANVSPEEIIDTCISGTKHVLKFTEAVSAKAFLNVSSGAVYGNQACEVEKVSECYLGAPNSLLESSAYGEGKRVSEWLVSSFGRRSATRVCSARCFAFVGPYLPLDKQFAIGNFLAAAMNQQGIFIRGDGTPLRSYMYSADMAVWLWAILLNGKPGAAYNVGSEEAISIRDLAYRICTVLSLPPRVTINQKAIPGVSPERYIPSTINARSDLGVNHPISLDEAIIRTVAWHSKA
ncbi:NAD(P)-dependent oxidoreductase [Vogesella sp. XCS3]|uniref:NAD-dependent epimerase/dehydratase family protein n=1 Tax=Vogesella sp. XCS3 TaxID=2877939 RepID=UPI001D09AC77|nr:NAD-dependent epimerase/dehydratase family protein [Vogesella sp. XCS3]UDM16700.1 NAD-dependent epimerase/dehydratase family protein [Vogesella sp. XCS3]